MTQNDDSRIDSRKTYELKEVLVIITVIVGLLLLILLASTTFRERVLICNHFVDNEAVAGGDGSLARPWNNIAGHVADLVPGDVMCIRGDPSAPGRVYTENIINLTGCNSGSPLSPIVVRPYQDEYVEIVSTASIHGINVNGVQYWTFQDLYMDAYNPTHMININGDHNTIENCTLYDGEWGIRIYSGNHNTVRDCMIYNFDSGPYKDAHGIYLMKNTYDTTIEGNTIADIRGDCIQLGRGTLSGTLIENNHLYTTLGKCSENAIDLKGGSPVIRGNTMHGFRYCDGSCGATGGGTGEAIVIQNDAVEVLIHGNEFYDCASGVRTQTGDVTIINNLFHNFAIDDNSWLNSAIALVGSDNTYVDHNTFAHLPRHFFFVHTNSLGTIFTNNLLYDVNRSEIRSPVLAHHNGWFKATHPIPGDHDITGDDPLLTANYRLAINSPARGAGEDGTDLGAFPYSEGTPEPTFSPTPTWTSSPTATSSRTPTTTPTSNDQWWRTCTPPATHPVQPTYTPNSSPTPYPIQLTHTPVPLPTCRPQESTPTRYPTSTPYPIQPTYTVYPASTPYPPQP